MSLPPSDFAATFRALVIPKLSRVCEARALFVALELETYGEARKAVMAEAFDHDAGYLPVAHFDHLLEWVSDTLCANACRYRADIEARNEQFQHVQEDIDRWNASVLEACAVGNPG